MRIVAISGSLQAGSSNLGLLHAAAARAPAGVEFVLFDGIRALPQFDPDLDAAGPGPAVASWRAALGASSGVLIASPEYGFSLPGSLKNAIDWVIGSGELAAKPVAITSAVTHADRGRRGLAALAGVLAAVNAIVVGGQPIVRGATFEADAGALLDQLLESVRQR